MEECRWVDAGDGVLWFEIRAAAFCWQMVRSIVGTLVVIGTGARRAGEVMGMLRARDRAAAGNRCSAITLATCSDGPTAPHWLREGRRSGTENGKYRSQHSAGKIESAGRQGPGQHPFRSG